jgi:hypothetical protein
MGGKKLIKAAFVYHSFVYASDTFLQWKAEKTKRLWKQS